MDENTAKQLVIDLSVSNGFQASTHSTGYHRTLLNGSWVSIRSCKHNGEWLILIAWVHKVVTSLGPNSWGDRKLFNTPDGIQKHIDERIVSLAD